jgi:hypothetical protein
MVRILNVIMAVRRLRPAARRKAPDSSAASPEGAQPGDTGISNRGAVVVLTGIAVGILVGTIAGIGAGLVTGITAAAALNALLRPGP